LLDRLLLCTGGGGLLLGLAQLGPQCLRRGAFGFQRMLSLGRGKLRVSESGLQVVDSGLHLGKLALGFLTRIPFDSGRGLGRLDPIRGGWRLRSTGFIAALQAAMHHRDLPIGNEPALGPVEDGDTFDGRWGHGRARLLAFQAESATHPRLVITKAQGLGSRSIV
jgi:hypothetical protein